MANRSGLQFETVRHIAMAWVQTLRASIILAAFSLLAVPRPTLEASGEMRWLSAQKNSGPVAFDERALRALALAGQNREQNEGEIFVVHIVPVAST